MNCNGKYGPLSWHATKIKQIVRSTIIAAEALSVQGLDSGFYYRKMMKEILCISTRTIPITAYTDNKSVIEAVCSTKLVDDNWLRVDVTAISQSLVRNGVKSNGVQVKPIWQTV